MVGVCVLALYCQAAGQVDGLFWLCIDRMLDMFTFYVLFLLTGCSSILCCVDAGLTGCSDSHEGFCILTDRLCDLRDFCTLARRYITLYML